jgi:hypothetical protein
MKALFYWVIGTGITESRNRRRIFANFWRLLGMRIFTQKMCGIQSGQTLITNWLAMITDLTVMVPAKMMMGSG